ncbi:MAG: class I SAM-dependent methyltransferase [Woeseia sp.]|nr:class I SAM-dependent methyltransferase [Woeseia sp.]NNE60305.1 class I SAM-dependent methyltransferase [Woeseia sp.]
MPDSSTIDELIACPRCDKTPLFRAEQYYCCKACDVKFPLIGELPWLFAEPGASLGEWRNRLHFALQQLAHDAKRTKSELLDSKLADLTKRRLELMLSASEQHRHTLKNLLLPIDMQSLDASYESHLALRTRLPGDQGLNTYYANAHRDWCWGDKENEASLDQLRQALKASGNPPPGDTLVLGAGAGRLSYDVHQQLGPTRTVAVDFNPLLMFIARDLTRGEQLQLFEFPLAPRTLRDTAVSRTLSAPNVVRDGFFLLLADVLRPPFATHSFDTVITPWLVDIVSEDFPIFAQRINALLKPGGRWLNFGSLAFDSPQRRRRYSAEEVIMLVEKSGFAAPEVLQADIPYMCSPASRHGRIETVFTFAAYKKKDLKPPPRHKALPDWLVTGKEPVPLLPSFRTQALSTQIYSFIMSLIDGKRTIDDMAKLLEQQKLMSHREAVPAIRQFLTKMFEDSQRPAGF